MTSPRTGSIGVGRPTSVPLRARASGLSRAIGLAVVRTPEITVGAIAVIVTAAFSWVPSIWYDEGATVTSATRTWAQLWAELHSVDAVHGFYYALMHVWFELVGYTPFTLRFPSALAIGVAAGLVVALGRRLGGLRLGVVSGLAFVLLPRVAWAGSEGRPYATITALSVCLTLVGLTAVRRTRDGGGRSWWAAYAVLAALAVAFNLYLSLAVVAHGAVIVWTRLAERRTDRRQVLVRRDAPVPLVPRRVLPRWFVAACVAAALSAPVALLAAGQTRQVSWIQPVGWATLRQVFSTAWFGASYPYAAVAWALMITGVVLVVRAARAPNPSARDLLRAQALRVVVPLVVVPTALLVLVTAAGEHLYSPKYASLSLPFVALLIGLAVTSIRPRRWLALALVGLVLASVPTSVAVRTPHAKQDSYWASAARLVESKRQSSPDADEGVVYGSVYGHPAATSKVIADAYPSAFVGMRDLAVATVGAESGALWDRNGDIATTIPARLGDIDTVWFVGAISRNIRPEVSTTLKEQGFHVVRYWHRGTTILWKYER